MPPLLLSLALMLRNLNTWVQIIILLLQILHYLYNIIVATYIIIETKSEQHKLRKAARLRNSTLSVVKVTAPTL